MARNYAALPHEYLEEMADLDDAEFGRLIRALLKFSMTGEVAPLEGNERFFSRRIIMREQRYQESYESTAAKNRENGKKGGRPKKGEKPSETQKTQAEAEAEAEAETEAKAKAKAKAKAEAEAETKANTKADSEAETETKANTKADSEAETKTKIKTETKTETETQTESKPEAQAESGPEAPPSGDGRSGEAAAAVREFLDRINPNASRTCLQELCAFAERMGGEVCLRAMEIALDGKKANWPYIRGILRRWQSLGVTCAADIARLDQKPGTKRGDGGGGGPPAGRMKRDLAVLSTVLEKGE